MKGKLLLWGVYCNQHPGITLKAVFFDRNNAVKWMKGAEKMEHAEGEYEHTWSIDSIHTKDEIEMKSVELK